MSKTQVLEAAFASRVVKSWVATDREDGPDLEVMFQYDETARRKRTKPLKRVN